MHDNQKFDHLIKDLAHHLTNTYATKLVDFPEIQGNVDASPLLNLTLSVYLSSLLHVLDFIKNNTIGEIRLIENIELTKKTLIKSIENLPFIKKIEHK